MKRILEKIHLKKRVVRKPLYQAYDKITFQELDEVSNYHMPKISEKVHYGTSRIRREKPTREYKATT